MNDLTKRWAGPPAGSYRLASPGGKTPAYSRNAAGQVHSRVCDQDGRISGCNPALPSWLVSYDAAGRLIAESGGSDNLPREYVWLDDTPLAVQQ